MSYCGMFNVLILMLIGAVSAITIPEGLHCCSPELGVYQYISPDVPAKCRKGDTLNPLTITCTLYDTFLAKYLNLNITKSGQVYFTNTVVGESEEMKRGEICFANYTDVDDNEISTVAICSENTEQEKIKEIILTSCMLVSAVFLLITTVTYAVLPEVRDLQGISLMNFCGSMGIGLTIFSVSKFVPYSNMTLCAIRGFITYFFLMAAFFWSNAISVQMLLFLRRPAENNSGWKDVIWYALYAWGCPTLLTLCMVVVNYHPGDHKRPGIGLNHCWFYNTKQQWYYMYSVMSILIVINICIFIYTLAQLRRLSFSSSRTKALRYKFVFVFRMFIIMGISWVFEMISSLTEKNFIWFIVDLFNILQGPLIFLLLVAFRNKVMKALLNRRYLFCLAGFYERYLAAQEDDEESVICGTGDSMNEMNRRMPSSLSPNNSRRN